MIEKPPYLTQAHLTYLDALQQLGSTNMLGAGPYLTAQFPDTLTTTQATQVVEYWIQTKREQAYYELIDMFLRENLDADKYALYSKALERIWARQP